MAPYEVLIETRQEVKKGPFGLLKKVEKRIEHQRDLRPGEEAKLVDARGHSIGFTAKLSRNDKRIAVIQREFIPTVDVDAFAYQPETLRGDDGLQVAVLQFTPLVNGSLETEADNITVRIRGENEQIHLRRIKPAATTPLKK